ncbi:MAG: acyl-CoA dehydrogenase family protein [Microscillaceae bacterium]|jgi:alkylation response protein AidB-like acyl-CoA dehydrogenase|nr:acyl-CoA dehydrogenase family protein [Microscillaceae bacterium]
MQLDVLGFEKTTSQHPQNRVLANDYTPSQNFWESDAILRHFLQKNISAEAYTYMLDKWQKLGKAAAGRMNELSQLADKKTPELVKRNYWGETLNEIQFHPAYWELIKIAVESEMFRVKWKPSLRQKFQKELHRLGFASDFLYSMAEGGVPCPLCMTDGVARLIDRYGEADDQQRLLAHIFTDQAQDLFTGAMFLTEKAGGSDVGANLVSASPIEGKYYLLNGEKWFCSNANANIIFALARTNPEIKGTKGLSIFLIEKQKPDGTKNPIEIVRLKDKLGVRSMASAECILTDTWGKLVGEEGEGFKIMTDMINLSRLYNAVGSVSGMRRALVEAYQFLASRPSFGKTALEHALVREKLTELSAIYHANFYLVWEAITLLDRADNGDDTAEHLLRLLTPMVKKYAAEAGVYVIRESMELMGGLGYIEDGIMPKLMRDTMVLPIWEGAGNIMILDMLRATFKSKGLWLMLAEIEQHLPQNPDYQLIIKKNILAIRDFLPALGQAEQATLELSAKSVFDKLVKLYQISLLVKNTDNQSQVWLNPALDYLINTLIHNDLALKTPLDKVIVEAMLAWEV